jgi:hypothetical protein
LLTAPAHVLTRGLASSGLLAGLSQAAAGQTQQPAYTAAAINHVILPFVQQQHAPALAVLNLSVRLRGDAALCLSALLLLL